MSDVLFEIKKENLETGLRGYPSGYCMTSSVVPEKGLFYRGHPVNELALKTPEEVIYILYHGKEGSKKEMEAFSKDIASRSKCSQETLSAIRNLPRKGHAMALFSAAILVAGMVEGKNDYREDCLDLIAKIPEIAATVINHHAGWGNGPLSDPSLGYIENFVNMLNIPGKKSDKLVDVFKFFDILHFDHGGGNLCTFVGKAIASGLEDMYGSISGAMCALAGPRHGKANQDSLEFIDRLVKELGEDISESDLEKAIRKKLANKELIYGFGHAVLRVEDPRATMFYEMADKNFKDNPYIKMTKKLREVVPGILKENEKIQDPYPNVDAISGSVLAAAGFNYPQYFTVLFGVSRTVGIAIQIVYERLIAREGKGLPIVRPKYIYKEK
ncbi:MAG: citrate (Si)-synthase [Chlamydiia bacterium]|nr:citrate (Si)-synthase [Chlamydiia bacterium]